MNMFEALKEMVPVYNVRLAKGLVYNVGDRISTGTYDCDLRT